MNYRLALVCVVGGLLVGRTEGQTTVQGTATPQFDMAEVRKLQEKRRDLLREALAQREKLFLSARVEMGQVVEISKRLLTAELDLAATDAERIAVHERHLVKAQALVEMIKARHDAGRSDFSAVLDAQAIYLEAQIGLLKAGGKLKNGEK